MKGILEAKAPLSLRTARDIVIASIAASPIPPIGSDGTGFRLLLEARVETLPSRVDPVINTYKLTVELEMTREPE
jgi:hypothetical protein